MQWLLLNCILSAIASHTFLLLPLSNGQGSRDRLDCALRYLVWSEDFEFFFCRDKQTKICLNLIGQTSGIIAKIIGQIRRKNISTTFSLWVGLRQRLYFIYCKTTVPQTCKPYSSVCICEMEAVVETCLWLSGLARLQTGSYLGTGRCYRGVGGDGRPGLGLLLHSRHD